ncbi:LysR family transcriptional regulator [Salmonella enterica]|nr:LysR family transcriptional regulator [Salmonella enterica]
MHITLRQLEVFAEVLKSGSTTQASVMLSLSQSAVSAALTDLEGQLGVQLFDRVGKRLVVNEHGRLLYPRALALLEQAVEIEQLFREDNGAIRVYASSTIGNYILPAMIARYRQHYPALPLEQLAASPWILRERGSGTREIVDYLLLSHLPRFHMAMELGNSEAIKHAVRHGLGISCLSRRVIAEQLQAGTLGEVAVPLPRLVRTLWRVHHRQKHLSNALQRFLSYCE